MGLLDTMIFGYRRLLNSSGAEVTRRDSLKIVGGTLTDDGTHTVLTVEGGGDIVDEAVLWSPAYSPNGEAQSTQKTFDTANATEATALAIAIADEAFVDINATVIGRSDDDQHFAVDVRGSWSRTAGTVTEQRAPSTAAAMAGNPVGWAAVLDLSGANARVRVTGEATTAIRWSLLASAQIVKLTATPAPSGFDPATLTLTGWWRGNFTGSPWTPTASAGTSGANGNFAEATNPPATGAALNGFTPADFDGTNDIITGANPMSSFVTGGAGSIAVLFNADTAAAPGGGVYDDEPLFCDDTANIAIGFNTSGVRGGFYDSGASWKMTTEVACATAGWHLAQMKWDGANIYVRVDSGAWTSVAAANFFTTTGLPRLGKNYNTALFDGRIEEVITAATALSDANFNNLIVYVNARYGLAL